MTVKECRDEAIKLFGNEHYADVALCSINMGSNDYVMTQNLLMKYRSMCVDEIKEGQDISVKELARGIYLLFDCVDKTSAICLIHDDGKIEFFKKVSEFDNLVDYANQCKEDE